MVTDTMLDLKEVRWQTTNGLSISTMNFDPGWPWAVIMGLETACIGQIHVP